METEIKLWNAIRTYVNYFGAESYITRKGLLMFTRDEIDLDIENSTLTFDTIKNQLIAKGYLNRTEPGTYLIVNEVPFNVDFKDLPESSETLQDLDEED